MDKLTVLNADDLTASSAHPFTQLSHLRVKDQEDTNKMTINNLGIVFGPTLMTVETSPREHVSICSHGYIAPPTLGALSLEPMQMSYSASQDDASCISFMIKHYTELFPVPRPSFVECCLLCCIYCFQVAKEEVQKDQVCV